MQWAAYLQVMSARPGRVASFWGPGQTWESIVKLTFFKGAQLEAPSGLFNASLEGNAGRALDLREGEKLDQRAFKALIKNAVALNTSRRRV
jgi:hypothetical protein